MSLSASAIAVPAPSAAAAVRRWGWTAAGATATAGVLHVIAGLDHLGAGELVVAFFLVTGLGQLASAAWLSVSAATGERPAARPVAALLAVTTALLGLYLVAHGTDLLAGVTGAANDPSSTDAHHQSTTNGPVALGLTPTALREPPGLLGTATVTVEVLAVLAFTALLPTRARRLVGNVLAVLGGGAWLLWLAGALG